MRETFLQAVDSLFERYRQTAQESSRQREESLIDSPLFSGVDLQPGSHRECPICGSDMPSWIESQSQFLRSNLLHFAREEKKSIEEVTDEWRRTYSCIRDWEPSKIPDQQFCDGIITFRLENGQLRTTCPSPIHVANQKQRALDTV